MARKCCENCMWGDICPADEVCAEFDALDEIDDVVIHNKIEYEHEWCAYRAHWDGNDKWGDLLDE